MLRTLTLALALFALAPLGAQELDEERLLELIEQTLESARKKQLDLTDYADPQHKERALEVKAQLESRRVSLEFDQEDPLEALDHLRQVSGLNLVVSAKARELFADEGLTATLRVKKITLKNGLELLLKGLHEDLAYGYRLGVVMIVRRDEWKTAHYLEVYDVRDLLHKPKDFPAPPLALGENGVETR